MSITSLLDGHGPVTAVADGDEVVASLDGVRVTLAEDGEAVRLSHATPIAWSGEPDVAALQRGLTAVTLGRPALSTATVDPGGADVRIDQWVPADATTHELALAVRDVVATAGAAAAAAEVHGVSFVPAAADDEVEGASEAEAGAGGPALGDVIDGRAAYDRRAEDESVDEEDVSVDEEDVSGTAEAPAGEAPVEEAPVEDAPVEEAPVEEAPVEDAPVEDATADASAEAGWGDDDRDAWIGGDVLDDDEVSPDETASDETASDEAASDEAASDEAAAGESGPTAALPADETAALPGGDTAALPGGDAAALPEDAGAEAPDEGEGSGAPDTDEGAEPEEPAAETVWGYVQEEVPIRGISKTDQVVGTLVPGQWYAVLQTANGWAHVLSADGTLEGWADDRRIIRAT